MHIPLDLIEISLTVRERSQIFRYPRLTTPIASSARWRAVVTYSYMIPYCDKACLLSIRVHEGYRIRPSPRVQAYSGLSALKVKAEFQTFQARMPLSRNPDPRGTELVS